MEHGIAMEPMKRKWAPSRVDTELFCIPEVTAVSSHLVTVVFWNLCCSIKHIVAAYVFDWEHGIALHPMQGFWASSLPRGMFQGISRVAAGTWGMFSSYSGDGHLKLHFVQRSQDSCLVRPETSEI